MHTCENLNSYMYTIYIDLYSDRNENLKVPVYFLKANKDIT